jgi:predicted dehydrogenase
MKFLIIGSGSIGKRHLRNLRQLGYQDVGVFDTQENVLADTQQEYGIQVYSSLEIALGESPDIVILATPTAFHISYALASAKTGAHLFIEKPISHSMEGIAELLATVREKDLVAMIAYSLRFFEGIRLMRDLINNGEVGEPLYVHVEAGQYLPDWRPGSDYRKAYSAQSDQGGGVLLDLSHELDYVLWIFGPVRHVSSVLRKVSSLEIDVEDTADILMEHASGLISSVHLDYLQRATARTCKVVGSEGTLIWDYSTDCVQVYTSHSNIWQRYEYQTDRNDMYIQELEHFIDCVQQIKKPLISLEDGIKVLQIALAAKKSAQSGRRQEVEDVI